MTATTSTSPTFGPGSELIPARGPRAASLVAFRALLARDLTVTRKHLAEVVPRTLLQPLLLMFVFTYVFPKIGQGVGGIRGDVTGSFSTLLVAGVVALSIIFQGIQSVALPMVQEFGYTREIEDRVQAPLPVSLVAFEKIVAGAVISFFSALVVFPIAAIVPATPVNLEVDWPVLIVLMPLACLMAGALGLTFGTRFEPRTVPILFGVIVLPLTFLGAIYYTWASLEPIRWLQIAVLVNPLVYVSEGFRAALTPAEHMSLWAVFGALTAFTVLFTALGVGGFKRRVLAMPEGANGDGNAVDQQIVRAAGAVATAVIDTLRDSEGRVHAETAVAATAAAAGAGLLRDALGDELAKLEPGSVVLTDDVNDRGQALLGLVMTAAAQAGVAWDVSGDAPPPGNAPHGEIVDLVSQVEPAIVKVLTDLGVETSQWPTCCILAALDLIIQTSEVLDTSVATQVLTEALVAGSKTVPRPI